MKKLTFLFALFNILVLNVYAKGGKNINKNIQVTPTGLVFYENEIKTTSDGISYIFFICPTSNSLSMRLQIIDKEGNRVCPRGGYVISEEANKTWTSTNQHLLIDRDNNAIVAVQDYRCNPNDILSTYSIYKFNQKGEKIWGATVLNDSIGHTMEAGLSMSCCDDGGYIFAYEFSDENKRKDCVCIEKLDKNGKSLWKKIVSENTYSSFPFPYVIDAGQNKTILMYSYEGNKLKANIIDNIGNCLWEKDKIIYDDGFASPKLWEVLHVKQGPDNSALITIMDGHYKSAIVHLKNDGTLGLSGGTKGLKLDNSDYGSTEPAVCFNPEDNTLVCAYKRYDLMNKKYQGVYLQKFSLQGKPLWDNVLEFEEIQNKQIFSSLSLQNTNNGRFGFFYQKYDTEDGIVNSWYTIYNTEGKCIINPVQITDSQIPKQNLQSSHLLDGKFFITSWEEKRNSNYSIFMQYVHVDEEIAGINNEEIHNDFKTISNEIFSINGTKRNALSKGVNIVRSVLDGKEIKTTKVIVK